MQEVASSILVSSTAPQPSGWALGGLVAGEGSFTITSKHPGFADGTARRRFVFTVSLASRDRPLLEALRTFMGFGSVNDRRPRRPGYQPESSFTVSSLRAHHAATIPFAEQYLLPSAKRDQFERWRDQLFEYERAHPPRWGRGRSVCSVDGCGRPVRGRGLCRIHYYRATGY